MLYQRMHNSPLVAPRERRVSRNFKNASAVVIVLVAPRERRVSRNAVENAVRVHLESRASREACE